MNNNKDLKRRLNEKKKHTYRTNNPEEKPRMYTLFHHAQLHPISETFKLLYASVQMAIYTKKKRTQSHSHNKKYEINIFICFKWAEEKYFAQIYNEQRKYERNMKEWNWTINHRMETHMLSKGNEIHEKKADTMQPANALMEFWAK